VQAHAGEQSKPSVTTVAIRNPRFANHAEVVAETELLQFASPLAFSSAEHLTKQA